MANGVALREEIEKRGGKVTWQGAGKPIKVEYGGKTFDVSDYSLVGGKAQVSPETLARITGYQPVRSAFEGSYEVGWDPGSQRVIVKDPVTGKAATLTPSAVWGGRAYTLPEQIEATRQQLAPPWQETAAKVQTGFEQTYAPRVRQAYTDYASQAHQAYAGYASQARQAYADYAQQVQALTGSYINTMNDIANQLSDAGLRALSLYQQQFSQAVGLLQQYLTRQPEVPQSVKLAMQEVKKAVDENAEALAEEMNRRGILQSGIAAEEERKLREKGLTEQEKLLAQWLDQEHENMMRAVFELANLYASSAGPMAELQYQAVTAPLQFRAQTAAQALETGRELTKGGYELESGLLGKQLELGTGLLGQQYALESDLLGKQFELGTDLARWQAEQAQAAYEAYQERLQKDAELAWDVQSKLMDIAQKEADRELEKWKWLTPSASARLAASQGASQANALPLLLQLLALLGGGQQPTEEPAADTGIELPSTAGKALEQWLSEVAKRLRGVDPSLVGFDLVEALRQTAKQAGYRDDEIQKALDNLARQGL